MVQQYLKTGFLVLTVNYHNPRIFKIGLIIHENIKVVEVKKRMQKYMHSTMRVKKRRTKERLLSLQWRCQLPEDFLISFLHHNIRRIIVK